MRALSVAVAIACRWCGKLFIPPADGSPCACPRCGRTYDPNAKQPIRQQRTR